MYTFSVDTVDSIVQFVYEVRISLVVSVFVFSFNFNVTERVIIIKQRLI